MFFDSFNKAQGSWQRRELAFADDIPNSHTHVVADITDLPPPGGMNSGSIIIWAGLIGNIPSGYLFCNGASLLRVTYAALFTAIGTIYGAADGDHFNLPDLRDKFIVGAYQDDSGVPKTNLTGSLLASGGAVTHHHANHSLTRPAISNHVVNVTQPSINNHVVSKTAPVISNHTLTQPVVSAHSLTQPVVSGHTYTTLAARTSSASTINAITAVSAHSLSTNVGVSNHSLSTNVSIDAHAFTTTMDVAVDAHILGTNVGVGVDAHALATQVGIDAHDTLSAPQPFYAMAFIIKT